ncbi:MAG: flippase [Proteobacteria bacterium]|nr:flippase [Pseudomonadota bacterium]
MSTSQENTGLVRMVEAARGAAGILALRVIAAGIGFLGGILLARMLGSNGLGVLAYASAWVGVIMIPATLGFQQLLPREIARYQSQGDWGLLAGILAFSRHSVIAVSITLAVAAGLLAWIISGFETSSTVVTTFWIALLAVPFNSLIQIRQSAMRGLGHVVWGQVPETLVAPALNLAILAVLYLAYDASLLPEEAVSIGLAITILAFLIGNRLLAGLLPAPVGSAEPAVAKRLWLGSALPMVMITGMEVINSQTDIIMLGTMTTEDQTGVYTVAARSAALVVFVWGSVNMAIGPIIARTHYGGDHAGVQDIVRKSAIVIFLCTVPICGALYLFGKEFLSLYGPEFVSGQTALNILLIGNIVNALAGSVGLILKMTGHERDVLWTGIMAALANIILNAILIPRFGLEGAATATTISMSIWPLAAGIMVFRRLRINPTVFGPLGAIVPNKHARH